MFTEKQIEDLQTAIRQAIAEDDKEVSVLEDCECDHGVSHLTDDGIDHLATIARCQIEAFLESTPLDMLLFCPRCYRQHIDQPQPEKNWENPPHRSHECQTCGLVWRPADFPTNGVKAIKTRGKRDIIFLQRQSV